VHDCDRFARRLLLAVLVPLVSGGLIVGVVNAVLASPSPSPSAGKIVLRVGWIMDPDSLNPFIGINLTSYQIWNLNYDLLVGLDAATLVPTRGAEATGLATDWNVSPDGKTWTFTLRRNAVWQDGHGAVTAADVAFTYNYVIDNDLAAYTPYTAGLKRVEALDDHTVRFDCTYPKADMLMAANALPILPEHMWSKVSPKDAARSFANKPPVLGSGPFQCVEFKKGAYVKMVANWSYWRGAPKIDELMFEFYTNADTMVWDL